MRWCLLFVCVVGVLNPSTAAAQPPSPLDENLPGIIPLEELEELDPPTLRLMFRRARIEVRNRQLLARFMDRYPDREPDSVRAKHRLGPVRAFAGYDDDVIQAHLRDVRTVLRDLAEPAASPNLVRVPYNPTIDPETDEEEVIETMAMMVSDASVIAVGQAVAAVVHKNVLNHYAASGIYVLRTETFSTVTVGGAVLCDLAEYGDDPVAQVAGTAFLVDPIRVVTASHVADTSTFLDDYRFVFGYAWEADGTARVRFGEDEVYEGIDIEFEVNDGGRDAAVITLGDSVRVRDPLSLSWPTPLGDTEDVYAIGFPHGLPLTWTSIGAVIDNTPCNFFSCDLEVAEFNSGSPVFRSGSNEVVGIVNADYASARVYCDCWADPSYVVSDGRAGVLATRIGVVAEYLDHQAEALVVNQLGADALIYNETFLEEVPDGGHLKVPADQALELRVGSECLSEFDTKAGETWFIKPGPTEGTAEMMRCPQDGVVTGSG